MVRLIHLEDALTKLEKLDPEIGHIVELRFFVGCTSQETAEFLDSRSARCGTAEGSPRRSSPNSWMAGLPRNHPLR